VTLSSTGKNVCFFALFVLGVAAVAGGSLYYFVVRGSGRGLPEDSYFRAVYVLQRLGGPAALEQEDIPARVPFQDATESLLHHPDTIQVLRRVAADLAEIGRSRPKAPLFEAYARLALGERDRAAALLTRYVVENEYKAHYYALLSENLYALADYTSLLLICREWAERDSSCLENRGYYLWAALHNLGRYADAARSVAGQSHCLGWRAGVYEAKSLLAQGHKEQAESLIARTEQRFPGELLQIRRLWVQLRDRDTV
jgi:hypothetical protein